MEVQRDRVVRSGSQPLGFSYSHICVIAMPFYIREGEADGNQFEKSTESDPGDSMKLARVGLGWDTNDYDGADCDLDAPVFLLDENGKLLRDEDFVFYNNLSSRDGAVVNTGDNLTGEGDGDDHD